MEILFVYNFVITPVTLDHESEFFLLLTFPAQCITMGCLQVGEAETRAG